MSKVAKIEPTPVAVPQSETAAILSMIANPAVDIERMKELLVLKERIEDKAAIAAFNSAMAAAQFEMTPVAKNARNSQTSSNYADIGALADAITPIYTKHGFGPSFGTDTSPITAHIRIVCDLAHAAGHAKRYHLDMPLDKTGIAGKVNKTDTHALGSTLTYGRRYLKLLMFDVATKDDRDGNAAPAVGTLISEEQETTLREKIEATNAHLPGFCGYFKLEKLSDLKASDFDRAMAALAKKERGK